MHPAAAPVLPGVIELAAALSDLPVEGRAELMLRPAEVLKPGAVDRGRVAGAAQVDQEKVPGLPQCAHHGEVLGLGPGRREPGSALDREHRACGLTACVAGSQRKPIPMSGLVFLE